MRGFFMQWTTEKISSVVAMVLATTALAYSLYNGSELARRLQEQDERFDRHLRLSVQPNMAFAFYYNKEGTGWTLHNSGAGPAILKWFAVTVDGKLQPDWDAFRAALGLPDHVRYEFSVPYADLVVPPVTDKIQGRIFWIPPGPEADALKHLNRRVGMQVCYCSYYSECWLAGRDPRGPIRDSCESAPSVVFRLPRK
jgi:hypothetical protein